MADSTTQSFPALNPQSVLAVVAHPDDLDFCMAGSLARWADEGTEVYYLILTSGCRGGADIEAMMSLGETRRSEQRAAGDIVGAKDVFFCDYEDGKLEATMDVKRDIVRYIRQVTPDVVLTIDPTVLYDAKLGLVNHTDHRAAGQAAIDSVYPLACNRPSFTELLHEGLEPHHVSTLLLVNAEKQNFYVDMSQQFARKQAALQAHASQWPGLESSAVMMTTMAQEAGATIGVQYAEGFVRIDLKI
ncbi:MAG TPA: PIG-L deacetylase family protein [Candidatus Saccharimonadales bacterium]|jgi:LmbE family N-acetylglucosaminyl deacetylase